MNEFDREQIVRIMDERDQYSAAMMAEEKRAIAAEAERDQLRARVSELEAALDAAYAETEAAIQRACGGPGPGLLAREELARMVNEKSTRIAELELDHARIADLAETMAREWRVYCTYSSPMPRPEFLDALSELIIATGVELDLSEPDAHTTTEEPT